MRSAWDSADCDPIADIHSAIDAIKQSCGEQPPWPKARDDLGEALSTLRERRSGADLVATLRD
jgi:hypothetical protein